LKRALLWFVLFAISFSAMFLVVSALYFIHTAKYDGGVVFNYTNSAFFYSVKVSAWVGGVMASGIWYLLCYGKHNGR
jgi:hypothetical protein